MRNYMFNFTPQKLIHIQKQIRKKFPDQLKMMTNKENKYKEYDIHNLILKIKVTDFNDLKSFCLSLKRKELYALLYNFEKITDEKITTKVIYILEYRCNKKIINIMWKLFLDNYNNKGIIRFFRESEKQISNMNFNKFPYKFLNEVFKEDPVQWLVNYFDADFGLKKGLDNFIINKNNKVAQEIAVNILTKFKKNVFSRENKDFLIDFLSSINRTSFKQIIENYLLVFSLEELEIPFMNLAKSRLGDPTEDYSQGWISISQEAHDKAKKWFNINELKTFFDLVKGNKKEAARRFGYWLKYIDNINRTKCFAESLQLFLIFDKFVVIEFGNLGNAAYIYSRYVFDNNFAKYLKKDTPVANSSLKNRDICLTRILHAGFWEDSTDKKIQGLLT